MPEMNDQDRTEGFMKAGESYKRRVLQGFWSIGVWSLEGFEEQLCFAICGGENGKRLWVGKMLLIFRTSGKGVSGGEEFALLKYIECTDA